MKKNLYFAASLMLAASLYSCSSEDNELLKSEGFSVTAGIGNESRTTLQDDGVTVVWSEGDQIYLFGGNSHATMTIVSGVGETNGTFNGPVNGFPSELTYALYPVPQVNGGTYTYELASEITYSENSNAPMLGSLNGRNITFANLVPLVRIPLTNLDATRTNTLTLTIEGITGTAVVNLENGTLTFPATGMGDVVTVTIPEGVTDCNVDIPVPAGTYNGYEIKLNGNVIASKAAPLPLNVNGVAITTLGVIENEDGESEITPEEDGTYQINDVAELIQFAQQVNGGDDFSGKTVKLVNDIDLAGINWTPIGNCKTGKYFKGTFEGNGKTISNLYVDNSADQSQYSTAGFFGWVDAPGATIQNIKMDGATVKGSHWTGVIAGYATGKVSGCEVSNSTVVGVHVNDDADGDKIGGIVGFLNEHSYLNNNKVSNTTIEGKRDIGGIAGGVAASTYEMDNNVVEDVTLTYSTLKAYASAGKFVSGRTGYVPNNTNTASNVTIKYAGEVTDNAVLKNVIKAGTTEIELPEGTFIIPDEAQGKALTFIGTGDASETKIATQDDGSYEGCDYSLDGATVTFKNITINTPSTIYTGYARCNATYIDCIINGTYTLYDNSKFVGCEFNVSGDVYNIWTWGATTAEFNGCTFNSDGKAMLLYGTVNTKLTIEGCIFNDKGGLTDLKAAIEIGNDYGKSYELIVNETTVNGYEINDKGINTGTTLWANKNSMSQEKLNVVVDGVDVY